MKTRLIILVLLIVCFSCGTNNKPVSDAQKEKIKGEVKEVVNTIFKGCEEANFDMAIAPWLDSPDLVFIYNGVTLGYKETVDAMNPLFGTLLNQKVTIVDEKYAFLDKSTVIYTTNCKFLENYKDGHAILSDPMAMQFTLKKINNEWKVIYGVESSVRQNAKNTETSKELNQVELMKQMIGSWQGDIAKDTTFFAECKSYGTTGLEWTYKNVTKGKIVKEGKQFWGYDKKVDKLIFSSMDKGGDIGMYASWFLSKNKYIYLPYSDISNPETASFKIEGEIKSPDIVVETMIVNNKPVRTDTYTRVK
jgi:hypothetical protein